MAIQATLHLDNTSVYRELFDVPLGGYEEKQFVEGLFVRREDYLPDLDTILNYSN